MKPIICFVLTVIFLVTISLFPRISAMDISPNTQNELNKRLNIQGAMGGNITLTSTSPIGSGSFAFVLAGKTDDDTPVAIKVTPTYDLESYKQEYNCYEKLNAMTNKVCEKYGILFVYHAGDFLNYKTLAMTRLDFTLDTFDSFSKDSILIIFRDMIKTLKFIHSKGISNLDVKSYNIMTKGANVFLMDFNVCVDSTLPELPSQAQLWNKNSTKYYDMLFLLDTMSGLAEIPSFCNRRKVYSYSGINAMKWEMKKKLHLKNLKYDEFIDAYVEFCFETIEARDEKRLPKYDYLYKMFDDLLYAGQNRSQRIVFEWLTPAERAAAMDEVILPIESIVFPEEN